MNKPFLNDKRNVKELIVIGFEDHFLDSLTSSNDFDPSSYCLIVMENSVTTYNYLNECIKQNKSLPSAIICNLNYLVNDNYFILENTRKNPVFQLIPFILFAEDKKEIDATYLLKKGVDDCYIEPVSWRDLRRRVEFLKKFKSDMIDYKMLDENSRSRIPLGKRLFDIAFASAIILILSPVLLIITLAIKLSSKEPIIYRSKRVGTGYQVFDFLKFRSMCQDADKKLKDLAHLNNNEEENAIFVNIKTKQTRSKKQKRIFIFNYFIPTDRREEILGDLIEIRNTRIRETYFTKDYSKKKIKKELLVVKKNILWNLIIRRIKNWLVKQTKISK